MDKDSGHLRALRIRQPYAELILRGIKKIEYPSRPTKIIGQRCYIHASRKWAAVSGHDADALKPGEAPTGVIVGTATITPCTRENGHYE